MTNENTFNLNVVHRTTAEMIVVIYANATSSDFYYLLFFILISPILHPLITAPIPSLLHKIKFHKLQIKNHSPQISLSYLTLCHTHLFNSSVVTLPPPSPYVTRTSHQSSPIPISPCPGLVHPNLFTQTGQGSIHNSNGEEQEQDWRNTLLYWVPKIDQDPALKFPNTTAVQNYVVSHTNFS